MVVVTMKALKLIDHEGFIQLILNNHPINPEEFMVVVGVTMIEPGRSHGDPGSPGLPFPPSSAAAQGLPSDAPSLSEVPGGPGERVA